MNTSKNLLTLLTTINYYYITLIINQLLCQQLINNASTTHQQNDKRFITTISFVDIVDVLLTYKQLIYNTLQPVNNVNRDV